MRGLFITGTGTGVGKTFATALIARQLLAEGLSVGIYKPACSGAEIDAEGNPRWSDVETHFAALQGRFSREMICPRRFLAPAAPPVAARVEGRRVDADRLRAGLDAWRSHVDLLLVEGAGGWLSPLTETDSVADFAATCGFPLLIVAPVALGTINATLLTVESAERRGASIAGILLNEFTPPTGSLAETTNPDELSSRTNVPILTKIGWNQTEWPRETRTGRKVDWSSLAGCSGG